MTHSAIVSLLTMLLLGPLASVDAAAQDVDDAPPPLPAVELSVNLERLKRKLETLPATDEERSVMKLNFYLNVYGSAPRINPLLGFDLHTGPVPFGGPSHADMLNQWTPEEFSAPVADLGSVLGWLFNR